ncbi:LAMI_0F00738g1_1 [Lachancea mirantina]|uniref:LAMI_0F00738g1_1 n=1 Tax=Lachancea mirantina TaxID=1230905 RepID=A0A1G4JVL0_9SACH|nr:LAMI_0F00738g1_1 [Lachancea mirantina]
MKFLVINPNSTAAMTEALETSLRGYLDAAYKETDLRPELSFFTGPSDAPAQIDGSAASVVSTRTCLRALAETDTSGLAGVLVACFSDHPLVGELRARLPRTTLVVGILDAAVATCVARGVPYSVITSNDEWVALLDAAIARLAGPAIPLGLWRGTVASGVPVLDLHKDENWERVKKVISEENIQARSSQSIILGCAGFSGLEDKLHEAFPDVSFIDSVVCGLEMLVSQARLRRCEPGE